MFFKDAFFKAYLQQKMKSVFRYGIKITVKLYGYILSLHAANVKYPA